VRARETDPRPNIILLYTDDQAPGMTGFEGNPIIKTPNIDRLAGESVQFTRCYVPTPQCAPCRGTILTGQYPHTHGVTTNGMTLSRFADTFTARLKKTGYACGIVGKWHLGGSPEQPLGFGLTDYAALSGNPTAAADWLDKDVYIQGKKGRSGKYLTDWHGDHAIEFIERFSSKPFFLWVCFTAPHEKLAYPPGTESLYPPAGITLPTTMTLNTALWPQKLQQSPPALRFKQTNETSIREARSQYFAMISRVDENIGRLLKRLDELKLRDNTVVVFTSDNGWALGDHALFTKGPAFYDELIRMPLVMRLPPGVLKGSTSYPADTQAGDPHVPAVRIDRLISTVDLAPTFCELAGLTPPLSMQGQSLLPMIRDPRTTSHSDERFLEYHKQPGMDGQNEYQARVRGIIAGQYKFIDYLDDNVDMFFDLKRDPREMENAINQRGEVMAQYAPVLKVLRERLNRWRKETRDPWPVQ